VYVKGTERKLIQFSRLVFQVTHLVILPIQNTAIPSLVIRGVPPKRRCTGHQPSGQARATNPDHMTHANLVTILIMHAKIRQALARNEK
jgi:hypothetical protein